MEGKNVAELEAKAHALFAKIEKRISEWQIDCLLCGGSSGCRPTVGCYDH